MAKANKSTSAESNLPKKSAAKKAVAKPATKAASTAAGFPSIDTSLAAENAAKQLVAGLGKKNAAEGSGSKPESSMFKQLKSGLNKPSGMSNMLDKTHGPASNSHKSNQPFGGNKQVGHNQTFGADVNRTGVPRRTGGG